MFTRKKKRYLPFLVLALFVLAFIVLWILWPSSTDKLPQTEEQVTEELNEDTREEPGDSSSKYDKYHEEQQEAESTMNNNAETQSYYLVKKDNHVIKIFFCDGKGNMTTLEDTDIIYDTLTEEDQQRFDRGIVVDDQNQLNELLMNYES